MESRCVLYVLQISCAPGSRIRCPGLESPYLVKDVLSLERVQRRASRLALGQKRGEMDYEDRLRKLKWPTLETRRLCFSLVECYKIVLDMNKLNFDDPFEFTKCNATRANHPYKLHLKSAKCNPYKYSFLSESYGTGIVYQVLLLRLGAWVVLRMR